METNLRDLRRSFAAAKKAAKIKGRCRIHDLRHTFATWAIRRGVDPKTLAEILGHADVRITLELYCHSSMEAKRSAVENTPDITGASRQKVHDAPIEEALISADSIN